MKLNLAVTLSLPFLLPHQYLNTLSRHFLWFFNTLSRHFLSEFPRNLAPPDQTWFAVV